MLLRQRRSTFDANEGLNTTGMRKAKSTTTASMVMAVCEHVSSVTSTGGQDPDGNSILTLTLEMVTVGGEGASHPQVRGRQYASDAVSP